jgi:hypothetical protein
MGERFSSFQIRNLGASSEELRRGRIVVIHPRCGRLVLEVEIKPDIFGKSVWKIVEIECPD